MVLFSGDNAATQAVQNILRLVGGNGAKLLQDASSKNLLPQQPPIVIHNMPPAPSEALTEKNGWRGELMKFLMGAGVCWASYVVFSQLLPESLKELLPVTRQFFDQAVTSLGQGIIRVRDVSIELFIMTCDIRMTSICAFFSPPSLFRDSTDPLLSLCNHRRC